MQLRERQYRSRLGSRPSTSKQREAFSITGGASRPPLQIIKTALKWSPLIIGAVLAWYFLEKYLF